MTKKQILWMLVAFVLSFFIVSYATQFFITEKLVENSRSEKWEELFRNQFMDECSKEAVNSIKANVLGSFDMTKLSEVEKNEVETKLDNYAKDYCLCMAEKVESAQIVYTKYNKLKGSLQEMENKNKQIIMDYLQSELGQKTIVECANI